MRRTSFKRAILSITTLIFAGVTFLLPHQAHADTTMIGGMFAGAIDSMIAGIMNIALWVMHWYVVFAGAMLNVSINLTLHIKDFVNATQGVYLVWQTIRDISGLFIIFMLLYASFRLILSKEEGGGGISSVGNMIKNIVIAGILINFSFFIVSLLIDASNIVSLAIYDGIVGTPQTMTTVTASSTNISEQVNSVVTGTGVVSLGDIFMSKLELQKAYSPSNLDLGNANSPTPAPLKTLLQGIVGIVIMFTAAMSFFIAAVAFAARLIILIILLAFSPVWFAAMIFPILNEKKKQYTDMLKGQLVFMPVYLLLLYAAMTIITKSTIFNDTATSSLNGTVAAGAWIPKDLIVLAINDFFIIFLLNLPLVTAFSMAGSSVQWLNGAMKKFGAENVWQRVGQFAGRNTVGRIAYSAGNSSVAHSLNRLDPRVGRIVSGGLSKVSSSGFGGGKSAGFDQVRKTKLEDYNKLANKSTYTNEQAERIATDSGLITNDLELKLAEKELADAQYDYGQLEVDLTRATTPAEQESIRNEIDKAQLKVNSLGDKVSNRKKAIIKGVKESPKEKMAQGFEAHRSVGQWAAKAVTLGRAGKKPSELNRAIADAIRKEKKPTDDIIAALKGELKPPSSGGGGTP